MTVPPWIFQRWMQAAQSDPAIKPAKVLYPKLATPQERAQLKADRYRLERRGRYLRVVGRADR
jgi:hypothetical protein